MSENLKNSQIRDIINGNRRTNANELLWRCSMAINYDKLFHMMIDKKITNTQLKDRAGVSANIITRLKRNEYVSMESIEKICKTLNCGVDDILEFDHICEK